MKVAIVWNHPSRLLDCSFRFEQYVAGCRALGHEPLVVTTRESAAGFDAPLHVAESAADFQRPEFWRETGAAAALIVTWHRMSRELLALREAGLRVAALSDTDGRVGVRHFPAFAFERLWVYAESPGDRWRSVKYGLGRYLRELGRRGAEDEEALASTRASDAVALGHAEGCRLFRRFLARHGEAGLGERVIEVPFTIGASFLECAVPAERQDRVVAVGRWQDPQKNAPLLRAALERFLAARQGTEIVIYGAGGADVFAGHPRIGYRGTARQEEVAETLRHSRAIVFASRWEGCPHAALEALATGATVVGTPIPSLSSWCEAGRYGRVAKGRGARALARALDEEMRAWDAGKARRDPAAIATAWRARTAPENVCRRLLEAACERATGGERLERWLTG